MFPSFQEPELEGKNHRCLSTHLFPLLPRQDRLLYGYVSRTSMGNNTDGISHPGKVGMSVLTKGLAMDFVRQNHKDMAITSIWPAAAIESAATEKNLEIRKDLRKATIYSDAILAMLEAPAESVNGLIDTDEDFLRRVKGLTDGDFDKYSVIEGTKPRRIMPAKFPVLEVEEQDDEGRRVDSNAIRQGGKPKL